MKYWENKGKSSIYASGFIWMWLSRKWNFQINPKLWNSTKKYESRESCLILNLQKSKQMRMTYLKSLITIQGLWNKSQVSAPILESSNYIWVSCPLGTQVVNITIKKIHFLPLSSPCSPITHTCFPASCAFKTFVIMYCNLCESRLHPIPITRFVGNALSFHVT